VTDLLAGPDLVYLDHAATTPVRPEVVEAMLPLYTSLYANPSGSHRFARQARLAIDDARETVASVIGCEPGEVVFTGCGTESDNAAIVGAVARRSGLAVCHAAEHHAVLHSVEHVGGTVVPTDECARVDRDALADALGLPSAHTPVRVVSVMAVNNEVGSIDDVAAAASIVRERAPGALMHTDAVQALSWLDLRVLWPHVDLLALSAHKFGGPKGVGVLAIRSGVEIAPLLLGGGQERDRRSGTHNVAGIVGMALAMRLADEERSIEVPRVAALRDRLIDGLIGALDDVIETVPRSAKVAGAAHVCIGGVESEALLFLLDQAGLCASAASACASGAMEPSHVLAAMGVGRQWSMGALRMSLGRTTTPGDVDRALEVLVGSVRTLRRGALR
jgi:cysteine desulfurase